MAFSFGRNKHQPEKPTRAHGGGGGGQSGQPATKLTNAQLNKLTKAFPTWLRDNSSLKQLPGVYQGVLGQVQLQPDIFSNNSSNNDANKMRYSNGTKLVSSLQRQVDYMNRFTDTERVRQLLSASRLPNDTLATIWAHVNKTFPGRLTNREVCLALALIAIFQRLQQGAEVGTSRQGDPFVMVKSEKRPPVPVLHRPNHPPTSLTKSRGSSNQTSSSDPGELNSNCLLIDFTNDDETTDSSAPRQVRPPPAGGCVKSSSSNAISLIDLDGDRLEVILRKLVQVWMSFLTATKAIFKRSFDILNVENSRQSALEALSTREGQDFCKHLSLCYPLAHNIKFKIDELKRLQFSIRKGELTKHASLNLLDGGYMEQINDLMVSVNEYWAVLINLFHESGHTKFIELIMDGLNYSTRTVSSETLSDLMSELDGSNKPEVCSICHTKLYLAKLDQQLLAEEDLEVLGSGQLITRDDCYYYHPKCANFWLNHVDSTGLPFRKEVEEILKPENCLN